MQDNLNRQCSWVRAKDALPNGVVSAWHARQGGRSLCAVFHLADGGTFMLAYQKIGEAKPTVERFETFDGAQEKANTVLSTCLLRPRV